MVCTELVFLGAAMDQSCQITTKMALKRLENTEKKLASSPAVASAYSKTINQYIKKVISEELAIMGKMHQNGIYHMFQRSDQIKRQLKQELSLMRQRSVTVYLCMM